MSQDITTLLKLSQPQVAIFSTPVPRIDFPPLPHLTPEVAKFAFAYHTNNFEWQLLKSIMLSDKVLACYAIYLEIHIDNRMCDHLINSDHANSFSVWVYRYQKSFGALVYEQFVESLIQLLINSLYCLDLKNNEEIVNLLNNYFKVFWVATS
ncbi:14404_t:CDS:2 [Gigaspora margarita]|uniref:14404_t:CDS:1 n=1 Tax=Gigaspora margarita TaxID=4874 RepID=A0ABN7UFP6_GIGMA|nr:14404_t:CDS:2 [Gigaspora margarita]